MVEASCDVLIFCDVGPTIGVGHLMRCVALAEGFLAAGRSVRFVADVEDVPFAREQLTRRSIGHEPGIDGLAEHRATVRRWAPDVVVVDSYRTHPDVYAGLRAEEPTLLTMVDGDPAGKEADLYLDQNIGAESDRHQLAAGAERLAGLRYALMRDDIRQLRPAAPRTDHHTPPRVLAFFGGTDAFGAAPHATRALLASGAAFDLTVVAGNAATRTDLDLLADRAGPGQRVTVIEPTDRIAQLVTAADLVVSAAGTSTWELLCLGAACALVAVADNQYESYARTVAAGNAAGLGLLTELEADPSDASRELAHLLTSAERREQLRARGWSEVDGQGRDRVAARAYAPRA